MKAILRYFNKYIAAKIKTGVVKKYPIHCIATRYTSRKAMIIKTVLGEEFSFSELIFFDLTISITPNSTKVIIQILGISEGLVIFTVPGI